MKAYTKKAKKVLDIANRVSKSMNYNYVGTEHLLVGLLKEGTGVAAGAGKGGHRAGRTV